MNSKPTFSGKGEERKHSVLPITTICFDLASSRFYEKCLRFEFYCHSSIKLESEPVKVLAAEGCTNYGVLDASRAGAGWV
jgi:hypothetical protein